MARSHNLPQLIVLTCAGQPTSLSVAGFRGMICSIDNIEGEVQKLAASGIEVGKIDVTL